MMRKEEAIIAVDICIFSPSKIRGCVWANVLGQKASQSCLARERVCSKEVSFDRLHILFGEVIGKICLNPLRRSRRERADLPDVIHAALNPEIRGGR